jgi:putative transposase
MNATLETMAVRKKDKPEPAEQQKLAEELVARAGEQGVSLTGPDGLLKQLTKTVIETALDQEMTGHLGHEKNRPAVNEAGNVRNGTRPKTVLTEGTGEVAIEVPRDREGSFEPQIVKKRQRRLSGVDEIVLSLYQRVRLAAELREWHTAVGSARCTTRHKITQETNSTVRNPSPDGIVFPSAHRTDRKIGRV